MFASDYHVSICCHTCSAVTKSVLGSEDVSQKKKEKLRIYTSKGFFLSFIFSANI